MATGSGFLRFRKGLPQDQRIGGSSMWPERWSFSIRPRASMSQRAPLGWTQFHDRQSSAESFRRLAPRCVAIRSRMEARSASVISLPLHLTFTTTAAKGRRGSQRPQAPFLGFFSAFNLPLPPLRRSAGRLGVAAGKKHVELVGLEAGSGRGAAFPRPEGEAALGEPLLAEPEALPVVDQDIQRGAQAVSKDVHSHGAGVAIYRSAA